MPVATHAAAADLDLIAISGFILPGDAVFQKHQIDRDLIVLLDDPAVSDGREEVGAGPAGTYREKAAAEYEFPGIIGLERKEQALRKCKVQ